MLVGQCRQLRRELLQGFEVIKLYAVSQPTDTNAP
jgi:hypothetical protein